MPSSSKVQDCLVIENLCTAIAQVLRFGDGVKRMAKIQKPIFVHPDHYFFLWWTIVIIKSFVRSDIGCFENLVNPCSRCNTFYDNKNLQLTQTVVVPVNNVQRVQADNDNGVQILALS